MKKLSALLLALLLALSILTVVGCKEAEKGGKAAKATTTTGKSKEVNANWTINVNDKHTIESQGLPIDYTLKFTATKAGGTDPIGTYRGTARLTIKADFSKFKGIPQSVIKVMGGVNGEGDAKDFTFKVVNFSDAQKSNSGKSSSGDTVTLATLVPPGKGSKTTNTLPKPTAEDKAVANPDFYSFGYMDIKGRGSLNIKAKGIRGEQAQYSDQKAASDKISFSMNIVGATVYIDIPKAGRFKGTVTGDPIN
ncbi:MAG TPA: hypothetical protein VGK02_01670 [Candidatus Aquicultor sp.]|jgi:hypothetical protein